MVDLNQRYRDAGWGLVTDKALRIDPANVESVAREVAQWAYDEIAQRDALIRDLLDHEGAEGFSVSTHRAIEKWVPLVCSTDTPEHYEHFTLLAAMEFVLVQDDAYDALEFLKAWREGAWSDEWPEFAAFAIKHAAGEIQ